MVAPFVHDEEAGRRGRREPARLGIVVAQRLLAINRNAARQQRFNNIGMGGGG